MDGVVDRGVSCVTYAFGGGVSGRKEIDESLPRFLMSISFSRGALIRFESVEPFTKPGEDA